ncbi:hypothetical protein JOC24_004608 [Streptomyces sp. HB132]|nr:hypothetical protein [Streptomyces sp. HB132]
MINQMMLTALRPPGGRSAVSPACSCPGQRQGPVTANVVPGV